MTTKKLKLGEEAISEISMMIATAALSPIWWNGINETWVSSRVQIVWSTAM
jgi:hypothetical protein